MYRLCKVYRLIPEICPPFKYFYPIYVNEHSNHSIQVLKELPKTIGNRISINSTSKEIFEINSKIEYKDTLKTHMKIWKQFHG